MSTRKKANTKEEAEAMVAEQKAEVQATPIEAPTTTAIEVQQPPGALAAYELSGEDMGGGHEDRREEDNVVPMLLLLQPLSPQVTKDTTGTVKPGMLVNTATGKIIDPNVDEVELSIGHYWTRVVQWIDRDDGGGFVGERDVDDEEFAMARQKAQAENGGKLVPRVPIGKIEGKRHQLVETLTLFGALSVNGQVEPICIPCTSTKLKPARSVTQALRLVRLKPTDKAAPSPYLFRARIKTVSEDRGKNTSFNFRFTPAVAKGPGPVWDKVQKKLIEGQAVDWAASFMAPDDPFAAMAKAVSNGIKGGALRADHDGAARAGGSEAGAPDGEAPF